MVKISGTKQLCAVKKTVNKISNPVKIDAFKLTQFSGAQPYENMDNYLKNEYIFESIFDLRKKLLSGREKINSIAEKSFSEVQKAGSMLYVFLKNNPAKFVLKQLRNERLVQKSCFENNKFLFQKQHRIPYTDRLCLDMPVKQIFCAVQDSILISPRLQMHYITGERTDFHFQKVRNYQKILSSCKVDELIKKKIQILKEFSKYTSKDSLIPDFVFSKADISRMKKLVQKYDAIDNLLKKHNVQTNAIETLIFSGIEKKLRAGSILPNKDILMGFSSVYDKQLKQKIPVILTFANTDIGYRFKSYRYDKDLVDNVAKYKKQVSHFLKTKNYKAVNDLNKKIMDYLKNIQVSEAYAEILDKTELVEKMKKCPDLCAEKIDEIFENSSNTAFCYVKNLRNFNIKRYYNASNPIIKCMQDFGKINNINETYIEAIAFNDVKHSPAGLYLRIGFTPVSVSKEELEKALFSKEGIDYKKNIWLVYKGFKKL